MHYFGTDSFRFYLTDGCTRSSSASANLSITFFNYPPTASDSNTFTDENVNFTIQLTVSDVEDSPAALSTFVRSLPDPSLATLYHTNNGSVVQLNDQLSTASVRYVPKVYACCETSTFTFQARDTANQFSSLATVSTFIRHVNQAPTAYASSPILLDRGVRSAITISASDPDVADVETFVITTVGTGTYWNTTNSSTPITAPVSLGPVPISSGSASQVVYFTALPFSTASTAFIFYVIDSEGLTSASVSVTVNIRANQNPRATAVSTVAAPYFSTSSVYYLLGTDPDPADVQSSLNITILSLPSKGTLNVNGVNITSAPATFSNNASFYIIGNNVDSGNDQFTFRVVDTLGGQSTVQAVNLRFVAVNRQPTGSIATIVTQQDVEVVGRVNANDPDNNVLTIRILSLPGNGTLMQLDRTPITSVPTSLTDSNYQFRFLPGVHEFGAPYTTFTFLVDDGTNSVNSQSAVVTATVNVTDFNYPPTAVSTVVSIPQESNATNITVTTSDIETPDTTVAILLSLPPASGGVLTDVNGNIISVGSTISSPWTIQFTPTSLFVGTTSFQFKANDGVQDSNNIGVLTINVTQVNLAPSSQVYLGTAVRQVSFPISLVIGDPNVGDTITITVTSFGGLGVFSYPDTRSRAVFPQSTPFNLPYTVTIPQSGSTSTVLNYLAPGDASGTNYANFSFYVTDQTGLSSPVTSTSIDITTNNPPSANAVDTIGVTQDFTSATFSLNGTDVDVADASNLQVIILSLPSKGTLFLANNTAITSAPAVISLNSIASVKYLTTQRGTDQFSFAVQDLVQARSSPQTVSIAITNTNHPPVAQWIGTSSGYVNTSFEIDQMGASDPDADDTTFQYYIDSAPTKGSLTHIDGTACASYACLVTSATNSMLFTPEIGATGDPYATFTFYVVDSHGTRSTTSATATISVTLPPTVPNVAPVAQVTSLVVFENSPATNFTLSITDDDSPQQSLVARITSLPPASLGVVTTTSGQPVSVGQFVASPRTLTFTPASYASGNGSITFTARDQSRPSNNTGAVNITVVHVNHAPQVSATSPSLVVRGVELVIPLYATDMDVGDVVNFILVSSTGGGVISSTSQGPPVTGSNTVFATGTVTALGVALVSSLYYNAPVTASGDNYASFTFIATDQAGNSSSPFTVSISVATNNPPTANAASISVTQDQSSTPITLSGSDPDVADQGTLKLYITVLPTKGYLSQGSTNITRVPTLVTGPISYTTFERGNDSFSFRVRDNLNATSSSYHYRPCESSSYPFLPWYCVR